MGKAKKRISIAILVIVVLLALFASLIGFISDFLWFKEMGYLSVFFKQLVTQLTVGIPTLIIITGLVYLYLTKLRKGYFAKIASSEETNLKKLKITTLILSIVFGIFATVMTVMQLWFEILKFSNSTSFGIDDPLFGLDISFYIFRLDFLTQLNEILIGVIMGSSSLPSSTISYSWPSGLRMYSRKKCRLMHAMPDLKKNTTKIILLHRIKRKLQRTTTFSANLRRPSWEKAFLLNSRNPRGSLMITISASSCR